ncbi:PIKK family atypical protein kinase [Trichomonas vaginalis G3]|uniref:Serine/threonine-protein kinase TOR n=1 Tax=Trichomonas vaginalis (strain ATCC PRA-98 / G3) TaxID=412133 RepID=A2FRM9_TRIV3|nr:ataxia telangiectasia mutated (ATM) -related family [Trichomonas vaginalis G3]EAX92448.1 PIKK family atypical protein kinase [Trichomonas vaginalis G3]KAI5482955.1 ataxia telangiectasia mutated (ATM) -related family [Trichomonas vaginalis G3]|eukprot:XP_001305378.1 PIKK family atypical protein kinase [Trichomonas vaginalis G3]
MDLPSLPIPKTFLEMQKTYEEYYASFTLEMEPLAAEKFDSYIKEYVAMLVKISKQPVIENVARTAIGILSLHNCGYPDFNVLARIFDRIVPQMDKEYIRFTCWVAGKFVHHPNYEQSRYVHHLFKRCLGWIRAHGRRARHMSAARMIEALAQNAGSDIVISYSQLQTAIWLLVSHPSLQLVDATADAIAMFARATIRYGRSELDSFMNFFDLLCSRLISLGSRMKIYTALKILQQLIKSCSDYFLPHFQSLFKNLYEFCSSKSSLVQSAAYVTLTYFVYIDKQQFVTNVFPILMDTLKTILPEFPKEISDATAILIQQCPDTAFEQIEVIKQCACDANYDYDSGCRILIKLLQTYGEKALPIREDFIEELLKAELTELTSEFFIEYTKLRTKEFGHKLCDRIYSEIAKEVNEQTIIALETLSKVPLEAIYNHDRFLCLITDKFSEKSKQVRCIIPKAMYHLSRSNTSLADPIARKLFQLAIFDSDENVRLSILDILTESATKKLASPESIQYVGIFTSDGSVNVRKSAFKLIAKVAEENPMGFAAVTRESMLNYFFTIRNIPSIRTRAKLISTFPDLIRACALTVNIYSLTIIDIVVQCLVHPLDISKISNFYDAQSANDIWINMCECLKIVAPIDPTTVAKYVSDLIPALCQHLEVTEKRSTILSSLSLLYVLLSPPASMLETRAMIPVIVGACSKFLGMTHSRKCRMATLKVIGAIGVIDIHQRPANTVCEPPDFADDELTRNFFHPSRDMSTGQIDDTLLLNPQTGEQCIHSIVSNALLDIFKDNSLSEYHQDTALALVEILEAPKTAVLPYFDKFVTKMVDRIETGTDSDLEIYLPLFSRIVQSSGQSATPFIERTLKIINSRFNSDLAQQFLDLIMSFAQVMKDLFANYSAKTVCMLIQFLNDKRTTDEKPCLAVIETFSNICEYSTDLNYLIITSVSETIMRDNTIRTIKLAGLQMFDKLVRSVDIFKKIGPIVRSLEYCLASNDEQIVRQAMNLLYSLLLAQGRNFLLNADPILDYIKIHNLETPQLHDIIKAVSQGQGYASFVPIPQPSLRVPRSHSTNLNHVFSEEVIISKIMTPAVGYSRHLEQWLHSFVLTTIAYSPLQCIRVCSSIASTYRPLAMSLFKVAFLSCWKQFGENGRKQTESTFLSLINAPENYDNVVREILDLVFFMSKMDIPINIPAQDICKACIRYGYNSLALYILQHELYNEPSPDIIKTVSLLIDGYMETGEWNNAIAVWKEYMPKVAALSRPETVSKLRIWDRIMPYFNDKFHKGDVSVFPSLVKSLAGMARWNELGDLMDNFVKLNLSLQRSAAPYVANAMMHLRRWDDLDKALQSAPDDSLRCFTLRAISQLHRKKYEEVDKTIENAFSLLASRPITMWGINQRINTDTMLVAQQLVEISDMKNWMNNENLRPYIEAVWSERLATAPRNFDLWLKILGNRATLTGAHRDISYIEFFNLKSQTMDTKLHMNSFNALFHGVDPLTTTDPLPRISYVVAQWNTGDKYKAMKEMDEICKDVSGELVDRCHAIYASWLIETGESINDFKLAFDNLKDNPVVTQFVSDTVNRLSQRKVSNTSALFLPKAVISKMNEQSFDLEVLRMWCDVNTQLIALDKQETAKYVTNAIDALTHCCLIAPSFTDIVQLLNLFFEHANIENVFNHATNGYLNRLSPKLILQASPQVLVQLSHPVPAVAQYVHNMVLNLLHEHYHELIFSVIVMKFSRDNARAKAAFNLFDEFKKMNPSAHDEVFTIRKCLLRAAVTWYEKVMQRITDAFDHYALQQYDMMVETLRSITQMVQTPKCALHEEFATTYGTNIATLSKILKVFNPLNKNQMMQVTQWCKSMQALLADDIKKIRIIQLASISESLAEKTHFQLAVPGTYKPGKPIIRIKYFVGQFSVYMSKQQPKDVVICGEDGNFYQYLVKGHEDLRLDERIQQFFRLINSYLKRETYFGAHVIQTMSVIPLSITNGLVQWVSGTDTLRSVVEQFRRLKQRDPIQEYALTEKLSHQSFDYMLPIQKMNIIMKVMSVVPSTDLANYFYLKARSPNVWHKRISTFAISAAITSMVGYVIGLGDRHPSNILIDRFTGKVIHIDFGDCFERASKRKFLPEVVPFRLTRMMVKAMGVTGTAGTFSTAFINTSRVLRENKRVLIMVLAIFVHEPLVDPREKKSSASTDKEKAKSFISFSEVTGSVIDKGRVLLMDPSDKTTDTEMRARVNTKLSGSDFGTEKPLSIEEQAQRLIKEATDNYNIAKMYSGWCPFW